MTPLPIPSTEAQNHSQQLKDLIQQNIVQAGGWVGFAKFMHLALYTPALGYYSAGSQKFGDIKKGGGDFVTAPEISPLFAQTLSNQIVEVLQVTQGDVLELGAGTGKLANDILLTLSELGTLPNHYFILEVSDHLRQIQRETLERSLPADLLARVKWLNTLPETFKGVMIGNEVLDALPVHIVHQAQQGLLERGVVVQNDDFAWQDQVASETLSNLAKNHNLTEGYVTEYCPAATGLIASLADSLQQGVILLIDYGFSAREYYHPQRNQGTLMCHYQHLSHANPLVYVGLQDITAHVDFTAIAKAGANSGLQLEGFCSQAQFLMNCGILHVMSQVSPHDIAQYAPLAAAAQKLLSPAEMGDLFKVIGFSKQMEKQLQGFSAGDKSHTL